MEGGPTIDAGRVIADLRELDRRTGGPDGARRLCWGAEWRAARAFAAELLDEIGLEPEPERDEAGNAWAYLSGDAEPALALGSHLDSVPSGGWLDGALGVMAGIGVLRAWAGAGNSPPRSLAVVDWADEEGARFGRSLFGSSAFSGSLEPAELEGLRDAEGRPIGEVLAENAVDLDRVSGAAGRQERIGSYLELHIEQGPVLEAAGLPVAAVDGCVGVERIRFAFRGQASHAGTTPMDARRDAGLAAAAATLAIEAIPAREGGVATTGELRLEPGIPTAVAGLATLSVDLRHGDRGALDRMLTAARADCERAARDHGCEIQAQPVWRIEPTAFDPELVAAARQACRDAAGSDPELTSGALHDAAEVARVRPAAMLFATSIGGLSHTPQEDTSEDDLATAIEAFGALANGVL